MNADRRLRFQLPFQQGQRQRDQGMVGSPGSSEQWIRGQDQRLGSMEADWERPQMMEQRHQFQAEHHLRRQSEEEQVRMPDSIEEQMQKHQFQERPLQQQPQAQQPMLLHMQHEFQPAQLRESRRLVQQLRQEVAALREWLAPQQPSWDALWQAISERSLADVLVSLQMQVVPGLNDLDMCEGSRLMMCIPHLPKAASAILRRFDFQQVNARLPDGCTCLHVAAMYGRLEICEAILARPDFTEVHARTNRGHSALDFVRSYGRGASHRAIEAFLEQVGS